MSMDPEIDELAMADWIGHNIGTLSWALNGLCGHRKNRSGAGRVADCLTGTAWLIDRRPTFGGHDWQVMAVWNCATSVRFEKLWTISSAPVDL